MSAGKPLACARVRVLMESFVDGDLARDDPQLAAALREHLAGCADCRRQHVQAISLPFRLKALSSPSPRDTFIVDVMQAVALPRAGYRRAWTLLAPEAILVSFILWYLSGLDGLSSIASGIFGDLQGLAGGSIPTIPPVDVLLLISLIALTAVAGYHLWLLIRLVPAQLPTRRRA